MLNGEIKRRGCFFSPFLNVIHLISLIRFMKKEVWHCFLRVDLQNVHVHIVDMSSARQVWEFANNFILNNTVHVLVGTTGCKLCISNRQALALVLIEFLSYQVNNAGCMVNQREVTEEGLEKNFATNTLGRIVFNSSSSEIDQVLRCKKTLMLEEMLI